ncbi:MAG: phage tail protein [bacterium]|nr:phage tail protein [bacterium]
MYKKIITILIAGIVFTAGLIMGFGGYVFAGDYNSSISNSSTAIVNQQVGDILLRYGVGGAEINKVTDALAVGISAVDLKATLVKFGVSDAGIAEVFAELDRLGAGDTPQSAPATGTINIKDEKGGAVPSAAEAESAPATTPQAGFKDISGLESETEIIEIKDGDDMTIRKRPGRTKYSNITLERAVFHDTSKNTIQNIKAAAPEERKNLIDELRVSRETFQTEIVSTSLNIRENAKELRDNFRKNEKTTIGHDKFETARIAVAHGKGLRMLNRFRSATARFDHILGRLESRIEKIRKVYYQDRIGNEAGIEWAAGQAGGPDMAIRIEEAKNMQVENEAKLVELQVKYESLLSGENPQRVAEEARQIAKELKSEIEKLHAKLREIATAVGGFIKIQGIPGK